TARARIKENLEFCFECFPRLLERRQQLAGSLSGGEQQMLALGRALMLAPRILLIDEPSVGLAPILVSRTIDKIKELKTSYSLTVLMAEQNFTQAIRIADRGYVIVHGRIAFEGRSAAELNNNDLIRKFYLGLCLLSLPREAGEGGERSEPGGGSFNKFGLRRRPPPDRAYGAVTLPLRGRDGALLRLFVRED